MRYYLEDADGCIVDGSHTHDDFACAVGEAMNLVRSLNRTIFVQASGATLKTWEISIDGLAPVESAPMTHDAGCACVYCMCDRASNNQPEN